MPIYCDEAGNTGYNLLVAEQPYFVYAALNIDESEANSYCTYLKKKYFLQGELKGANLMQSTKGTKAIGELYKQFSDHVKIVYYHKKYALACKYYEYVFEPVVANKNSFFYLNNFHRFIANLLYVIFENSNNSAEDLFSQFQELLKAGNSNGLFNYLQPYEHTDEPHSYIAQFTLLHKERILKEITTEGKVDYWILDLTQSALYDLLVHWQIELEALTVICDNQKPLQEAVGRLPFFQDTNQAVKYWNPLGQGSKPLNFKLREPVKFSSSRNCPGLQLADTFASSTYWALNHLRDEKASFILGHLEKVISRSGGNCIVPEPNVYIKPDSPEFNFGVVTLRRLTEFSLEDPERALEKYENWLLTAVPDTKRHKR